VLHEPLAVGFTAAQSDKRGFLGELFIYRLRGAARASVWRPLLSRAGSR